MNKRFKTMAALFFVMIIVGLGANVIYGYDVSNLNINLQGWTETNGSWTQHSDGVKAVTNGASDTFLMSSTSMSDFVLEADLKLDTSTPFGTAALAFRANAGGTTVYILTSIRTLIRFGCLTSVKVRSRYLFNTICGMS
ncbi:hypothetical protein [Paenibacillus sp. LHD-38]|uniref:hypothetical protein n=1 Tax=Paenibacillus sp. LHD-38 TaxID=3072143 RepID=UPI00280FCB0C|nr:hypothetical protein [Paenibacillus sp. LHD-38]MDQ8733673.1 hypothetical protein [Paenibacillus sp. LHD-38]